MNCRKISNFSEIIEFEEDFTDEIPDESAEANKIITPKYNSSDQLLFNKGEVKSQDLSTFQLTQKTKCFGRTLNIDYCTPKGKQKMKNKISKHKRSIEKSDFYIIIEPLDSCADNQQKYEKKCLCLKRNTKRRAKSKQRKSNNFIIKKPRISLSIVRMP